VVGAGSVGLEVRRLGSEKKDDLDEVWEDAEETEDGFVRADREELVESDGVDEVDPEGERPCKRLILGNCSLVGA
jgi:hypothetical protein